MPDAALREAAQAVLDAVNARHDSLPSPLKYGVPYGAINALRAALAQPEPLQPGEVLVALTRPEGYEDVHPELVADDALGNRWPGYRVVGQPEPPPLGDDEIREVFIAHGFTVKEGQSDLKPYVFSAARALLARAVRAANGDAA